MASHGKQTEARIRHAEGSHGGERDSTESRGLQNPLLSQREDTMHSPKRTESDWQGLVCEVRAVTHLLSSLLHMGLVRLENIARFLCFRDVLSLFLSFLGVFSLCFREMFVFSRCALLVSISFYFVFSLFSGDFTRRTVL